MEGACEQSNESSDAIKFREILEELHNWSLIKKVSTA
jgi:hypothetical protein